METGKVSARSAAARSAATPATDLPAGRFPMKRRAAAPASPVPTTATGSVRRRRSVGLGGRNEFSATAVIGPRPRAYLRRRSSVRGNRSRGLLPVRTDALASFLLRDKSPDENADRDEKDERLLDA